MHTIASTLPFVVMELVSLAIFFLLSPRAGVDGDISRSALVECLEENIFGVAGIMIVYLLVLKLSETKSSTRYYFILIKSDHH